MSARITGCLYRSSSFAVVVLAMFMVASNVVSAAVYPLEIIAPRSGLSTTNRYYKAYPGLVYDVNVAAIGGQYPYTFALPTAPSGMSIDSNTGRISWPSPVAQAQAYPVSVSVSDSAGATTSVSWTVLVTTSGFKFVDAVNGRTVASGGTGAIDSPWKTVADWYVSKSSTAYSGSFLYWRSGTYRTTDAPIEDGSRMAVTGNSKPMVWLAYPGETPVIDVTGSNIEVYGGSSNFYVDGIEVKNFTKHWGFRIESGGTNVQFRRNNFHTLDAGWGGAGTNSAALMISDGSAGKYWVIVDNRFSGIHDNAYGICGYRTDRTLVQGNTFTDFTDGSSKAIGPKMANTMWFIRDNRINMAAGDGIWVDTYSPTSDIEVSYNLVKVGSGSAAWYGQEPSSFGPITSLRNTYIGAVTVDNLTSSSGPVSFDSDIIVNSSSATNKVSTNSSGSSLSLLQTRNLLVGSSSSGIVDSTGNLTGASLQYLGTRGYQLAAVDEHIPNPPTVLTVQ